jgi:hypothetical protein
VARLPIDDTRDLFGVMWVYKDVITMQIITPETWTGDRGVLWDKASTIFWYDANAVSFFAASGW